VSRARAEARGFDPLVPGHSHIPPAANAVPAGGDLPSGARRVQAFIALAAAAAVTTRDSPPSLVAATRPDREGRRHARPRLNDRFLFGIGAGWNAEEMEDHGTCTAPAFPDARACLR
jgi:alkanesulfonate monooxygenase SsuD/methylene tetrahydromethanopterin reductase-like flavin-dependent oxidoreductase (luciferase family)